MSLDAKGLTTPARVGNTDMFFIFSQWLLKALAPPYSHPLGFQKPIAKTSKARASGFNNVSRWLNYKRYNFMVTDSITGTVQVCEAKNDWSITAPHVHRSKTGLFPTTLVQIMKQASFRTSNHTQHKTGGKKNQKQQQHCTSLFAHLKGKKKINCNPVLD